MYLPSDLIRLRIFSSISALTGQGIRLTLLHRNRISVQSSTDLSDSSYSHVLSDESSSHSGLVVKRLTGWGFESHCRGKF